MIKINYRLDYTGLKWDYTAPASKLVACLQEAAILHSEKIGLTMDYFFEEKKGWVIRNWDIEFLKPVRWNEEIEIETFPALFKGIMAHRGFVCRNKNSEVVINASSQWVYTDRVKLKPVKVTEEMSQKYGELKPLPVETDFKIHPIDSDNLRQSTHLVTRRDTDTNRHTNNISYLEWITDMLTDEEYNSGRITRLKAAFKKQCVMGDKVDIILYTKGNSYYAAICSKGDLLSEIYFERG